MDTIPFRPFDTIYLTFTTLAPKKIYNAICKIVYKILLWIEDYKRSLREIFYRLYLIDMKHAIETYKIGNHYIST